MAFVGLGTGLAACDAASVGEAGTQIAAPSVCVELAEGSYQFADGLFIPASGIPIEASTKQGSEASPLQWAGRLQDQLRQEGYDWLSIRERSGIALIEGTITDEEEKLSALEAASTAIRNDAIANDGARIIVDMVEIEGGPDPVGMPVASLPTSPSVSACTAAFAGVLDGHTVEFSASNTSISDETMPVAAALGATAILCDRYQIEIGAHTDARGAESFNQRLSQTRANTIRDYLIKAGVASASLTAVGYGESQPIDTSQTTAAYARNRRIEFSVSDAEPVASEPVD
ncbi:OmpA family protein [Henriciella barbarensis]|nr:OmpA family protein [Henriciella barbarensis]